MAKLFAKMIKAGTWTIAQVPERWRDDVEAILGEEGDRNAD